MALTAYPVNEFGPVMKGLIIGGLGIFHVFTAQFAIGGGILMCYFQWLAQTGRSRHARAFLDSYFTYLVLWSFVIGAVTGVAMWFTSIQISPRTIGMMIDEFHWVWATEWTFFCLEIVAGYAFYRYAKRLTDRARLTLLIGPAGKPVLQWPARQPVTVQFDQTGIEQHDPGHDHRPEK